MLTKKENVNKTLKEQTAQFRLDKPLESKINRARFVSITRKECARACSGANSVLLGQKRILVGKGGCRDLP